jgi:hypothetical protein
MADQDHFREKLIHIYYRLEDAFYSGVLAFVVLKTLREEYRKYPTKEDDIFIGAVVISTFNTVILALSNIVKSNSSSIDLSYLFDCITQSKKEFDEKAFDELFHFIEEFRVELEKISLTMDRIIELRDKSVAHLDRKHVNNPKYFLEKLPIKWDDLEWAYDLVGSGLLKIGGYLGVCTSIFPLSEIANFKLVEKTRLVYQILSGEEQWNVQN